MTIVAEKEYAHVGETAGAADHDRDLVHELDKRLDSLWRYDQYITNADGHADVQAFWREVKKQEQGNVKRIKELIKREIQQNCF